MTNAEARFNKSLRPRKPEGSLGRTAQDVHLDSHTAPELYNTLILYGTYNTLVLYGTYKTLILYGTYNILILDGTFTR